MDREVDKAAFQPVWLLDARVASVVADALLYGETGSQFYQLRALGNHAQPCSCTVAGQDVTTGDYALIEKAPPRDKPA
jgi:hypothetical protein